MKDMTWKNRLTELCEALTVLPGDLGKEAEWLRNYINNMGNLDHVEIYESIRQIKQDAKDLSDYIAYIE